MTADTTGEVACPVCGSTALSELRGHMEQCVCSECGWNQYSTVFPGSDVQHIQAPELIELHAEFTNNSAIKRNLVVLRNLVPQLREYPVQALLAKVCDSQLLLGRFPRHQAMLLIRDAEQLGVMIKRGSPG